MKYGTKNTRELSADLILQYITEYDIFKYYISSLKSPNKSFCSELRKDNNPTCKVSLLSKGWRYKDFGTGVSMGCFNYIMQKYNLNYPEALKVISIDFNLGLTVGEKINKIPKELLIGKKYEPKKDANVQIVSRSWKCEDLDYWSKYNINKNLLNKYLVKPLKGFYLNSLYINLKREMGFAYCFGNHKYKIMRPNAPKEFKWTSNTGEVVQGLLQLKPGGLLFITSSYKDVMSLKSIGYKSIAPQSEMALISKKLINKLKDNFEEIVIYYNNDGPGIQSSINHSKKYGFDYIVHPEGEPKDPSDFIKKYSPKQLKQLLQHYGFQ